MKPRAVEVVAKAHQDADRACGREWVCSCAPCRQVRCAMERTFEKLAIQAGKDVSREAARELKRRAKGKNAPSGA